MSSYMHNCAQFASSKPPLSKTHITFSSKYVRGLFLLVFSLIVLFSLLNQTPSLSAAIGPAQGIATTSTRFFESSQPTTATRTVTTTSVSTVSVTTTATINPSGSMSTTTQRLTETITTTSVSTSDAGLFNLVIGALVGGVLVGVIVAVAMRVRGRGPIPAISRVRWLDANGQVLKEKPLNLCGKCGKPAQNNICTGCGLPSAQCTCMRSDMDPFLNQIPGKSW